MQLYASLEDVLYTRSDNFRSSEDLFFCTQSEVPLEV